MRTRQETVPRRYSRMGIGGDGSTLNLDFTAMSSLDSRFTFSRASTVATYVNSSGYIATATTNEPRFDYNPTTLAPSGLLIEGSAINLQRYSATFETTGSYWYQSLGTNAAGTAATAPDNTSTPRRLTEPASGTSTGQLQISGASAGLAASTTYTVSFWAKAGTRSKVLWQCDGGGKDVGFNLDTGVATVVAGTFTNTKMTAYPNGWYRCEATWANVNAGGFPSIYLATGTGTTYTISYTCNSSYAELWGFQLETNTGASSYIPTVASQVTRATDVCTMSGTNFTSWFNNTEGTVLFIGNNNFVPSPSNFSANWALINAASSSRIAQYTRHTTGRIGASCRDSGGGALTFDSPSATTLITTTAEYKTAFALKSSDFAYSVNGAAVGLGDGVGVFETVASLEFARDGIRNGHVKCFKFWPTRLTNAQLIAIST